MKSNGLRIAILGPESTGKTALANSLANYYKGDWIEEIARGYVENLGRPYTYQDVERIAKLTIDTFEKAKHQTQPIFFDTEMIITKIWFKVVFGKTPALMDEWMQQMNFDAYLLSYYDLPWEADHVRENGGEMRKVLFYKYKTEIEKLAKPYRIIKGLGKERVKNAIVSLSELTNLPGWSETQWQENNPEDQHLK
jgi:nicotinamide riboside kinase